MACAEIEFAYYAGAMVEVVMRALRAQKGLFSVVQGPVLRVFMQMFALLCCIPPGLYFDVGVFRAMAYAEIAFAYYADVMDEVVMRALRAQKGLVSAA